MNENSIEVKVAKNSTKIESLEDNVSKIWIKWDKMQTLIIGTLVSTSLSLIGVVILLLKMK